METNASFPSFEIEKWKKIPRTNKTLIQNNIKISCSKRKLQSLCRERNQQRASNKSNFHPIIFTLSARNSQNKSTQAQEIELKCLGDCSLRAKLQFRYGNDQRTLWIMRLCVGAPVGRVQPGKSGIPETDQPSNDRKNRLENDRFEFYMQI